MYIGKDEIMEIISSTLSRTLKSPDLDNIEIEYGRLRGCLELISDLIKEDK